jgi:tripartite-type tricarboxylate transporter receptor subunit TctC
MKLTTTFFFRRLCVTVAALLAASFAAVAVAQSTDAYPSKPIRLVVPFPPGGPTDVIARAMGTALSSSWSVPVVVENRPGGNSFPATELVARGPADGYTLLFAFFGTLVVNPSLYAKLPYDPVKDFAPITTIATLPLMLVVPPNSPIHSINDLIALSKAKPDRFSFASGGTGQGGHLAGELFKNMAGISMTHVPYKGNALAVNDLLGGHVDLLFDGMSSSLVHVKSGRLRAIAVTTRKRASAMPELPTVDELGLPGFDVGSWFGVLAPAATPKPVVAKLNAEFVRIINTPELRSLLATQGLDPLPSTPEEFASFMQRESAKWGKVVREANIKPE